MTWLPEVWFFLIGILFAVYSILDGYDLGAGLWHLFLGQEKHRRQVLAAVGPVWDGNEVWLLAAGGAIFAAFPPVYAAVFSGMYLALVFLLLAFISRAVSIELRQQLDAPSWRRTFDVLFGLSSCLVPFMLGVALGNIVRGLDLDDFGNFRGGFFSLLNPFALLVGFLALAAVATHGAVFLSLKGSGGLEERAARFARVAWTVQMGLFLAAGAWALLLDLPASRESFLRQPKLLAVPLLALAALSTGGAFIFRRRLPGAFVFSALSIVFELAVAGASLFPKLVPAFPWEENSLTVYNSSSSEYTLTAMLVIAALGMPLVIGYTIWVQRRFAYRLREEVSLPAEHSAQERLGS